MGVGRGSPIHLPRRDGGRNWLCVLLGGYALVGGLVTLAGWAFDIPRLAEWDANGINMKPNAAVAASAAGLGVLLCGLPGWRGGRAVRFLGIMVGLIGGLTLTEHVVGWNLGIDTLLWGEPAGERATAAPGRMGPPACTAFVLIGMALVLISGRQAAQRAASALAIVTVCIAALPLTGYIFGADRLFAGPRLTGIALQTATMLLGLGVGVIAALPHRGVGAVVTASGPGGTLARALMLGAVGVPLLLGSGALTLIRLEVADAPFALALMAVVMVIAATAVVLVTAWKVEGTAAALAEREEQFRLFFEQSVFGAGQADPATGRLVMVNDRYCEITGYSREELLAGAVGDLTHPEDREADRAAFGRMVEGLSAEYSNEKRYIRADGRVIWVHATARLIRDSAGALVGVWGTLHDISARKNAEEALREQQSLLQTMTDHARVGMVVIDADHRYLYANPAYGEMLGRTPDELTGRRLADVLPIAYESQIRRRLERAFAGERVHYEELSLPVDVPSGRARFFAATYEPQIQDGNVRTVVVVVSDITERKAAEQELAAHRNRLQELVEKRTAELAESVTRLHAAERLAAVGNLAAGLGHDIANLVLPIRGRLEALGGVCTTPESRDDLTGIARALDHLSSLSSGMRLMALDPARERASSPVDDLAEWWAQAEGILRAALPRHVQLAGELPAGVGVAMPQHRLAQAVFNLVQNAGEALAGQEAGTIRVIAAPAAPGALRGGTAAVSLRVIDDGPGMLPGVVARCFEPYFSTKGRAIATGMGLGLVRGLVESAGGTVAVRSEPGKGATFTLILPVADGQRKTAPVGRAAALTVTDARSAALASMMLSGLAVRIARPPGDSVPEEELWVAQTPSRAAVEAYLAGRPDRRVIVLGGLTGSDGADEAPEYGAPARGGRRLMMLPLRPTPSALRDALASAAGARR
jgi:PAS domain S-box-containing protein